MFKLAGCLWSIFTVVFQAVVLAALGLWALHWLVTPY